MRIPTGIAILLILAPLATGCGDEQMGPTTPDSLTGHDYFRGAFFGRGPASEGTFAAEIFSGFEATLDESALAAVVNEQEETLVRVNQIDSSFLSQLERAVDSADRVRLMRQLDEASLLLALSQPNAQEIIGSSRAKFIDRLQAAKGVAQLPRHELSSMLADATARFEEARAMKEIVEPTDNFVTKVQTDIRTVLVETSVLVPSCQVATLIYCPLGMGTPSLSNGNAETELQREELVDQLIRLGR